MRLYYGCSILGGGGLCLFSTISMPAVMSSQPGKLTVMCTLVFRAKLSPTAVVQRSVDVPSHPSACCRVLVLTYTNICNFTANFVTILSLLSTKYYKYIKPSCKRQSIYEGWNFNSGNYLFTTDTK